MHRLGHRAKVETLVKEDSTETTRQLERILLCDPGPRTAMRIVSGELYMWKTGVGAYLIAVASAHGQTKQVLGAAGTAHQLCTLPPPGSGSTLVDGNH